MNMKVKLPLIFLLVIITTQLTSCVAAIVVGAAASYIVYDKRGLLTMESDGRIFYLIHRAIVTNPRFNDSRIVVTCFNGMVLLIGQTPNAELKILTEKIAYNTQNVKRVYDQISIGRPISLTERGKDSLITSQLRSLMLAHKGLESGSIRIVTENGNVYLMGIVTKSQAKMAVNIVRKIAGVHKVIKIFRYIV